MLIVLIGFLAFLGVCLGLGCWHAWRRGRVMPKGGVMMVNAWAGSVLLLAVLSALDVLMDAPWITSSSLARAGALDSALLLLTGLAMFAYGRLTPRLMAAGAAHHPAPVRSRSAQAFHAFRRAHANATRRVLPLLVLGLGVTIAVAWRGVEAQYPPWVGLGLLGAAVWTAVCHLLIEGLAKR